MKFLNRRREQDLDDEIRAHMEMARQDCIERGLKPDEAECSVRREFGNEGLIKEVTRQMWGWASVERWRQDTSYAFRTLRRSPGFAATAVLCLGFGIGVTAATFSLADALVFRPLPVENPSEVVTIGTSSPENPSQGLSYPDFLDIRRTTQSFESVTGFHLVRLALARPQDAVPRMKMGMVVTSDFFQTLGVQPALGRSFRNDETAIPGRDPVIVLSHDLWRSEFGARPDVIGETLRLNGVSFTVVGVTRESFTIHTNLRPAFYVPLTMADTLSASRGRSRLESRDRRELTAKARLKPGSTVEQARAEIEALGKSLQQAYPESNERHSLTVRTELGDRIQQAPQLAIMAATLIALAGLVLVIACANVANLLLARARSRSREIAVRLSIGAGRARLFQQLLTESLVLSLLAGAAGVLLAITAIRYLASFEIPTDTPIVIPVQLDDRVLLFTLAVSLLSAVLAGLAPAWRSIRPDIGADLKSADPTPARTRIWGRNTLVAGQVALSLVLLVVSATLLDAFGKMLVSDPGIRTDHVMMIEFDPGMVQYSNDQTREFYRQLGERTRMLPGVRSVSLASAIPFRPNFADEAVVPEGYELPRGRQSLTISSNVVDEHYFRTMNVEIVRGREFTSVDTSTSRRVAVINEEFARRYWYNQDPIGKRFRMGQNGRMIEVIGVARTGKYLSIAESPQPYFYLPFTQNPRSRMTLLAHTEGDPASITDALLHVVRSIDPNQPVYNVRDVRTYFEQGVLGAALFAIQVVWSMGLIGLLLAMVGLYGLIAYNVSRRTREIGIRMAIGADRSQVLRLVLKQGLILSVAGAGAGLVLSIPAFMGLSTALAGLGNLSPWTLILVPAMLVAVAVAACYFPAYRASRIDPNVALRFE